LRPRLWHIADIILFKIPAIQTPENHFLIIPEESGTFIMSAAGFFYPGMIDHFPLYCQF
jgi:hypothetical protein